MRNEFNFGTKTTAVKIWMQDTRAPLIQKTHTVRSSIEERRLDAEHFNVDNIVSCSIYQVKSKFYPGPNRHRPGIITPTQSMQCFGEQLPCTVGGGIRVIQSACIKRERDPQAMRCSTQAPCQQIIYRSVRFITLPVYICRCCE